MTTIIRVETLGGVQHFDIDTPEGYEAYASGVVQDYEVADEQIARLREGETVVVNEDQPEFFERHTPRSVDTRRPAPAHIVITGTPVDGFQHFGPFDDSEDASKWAEDQRFNWDWWVIELTSPEGPWS